MAFDSPASILYDGYGNPVNVIFDGLFYRLSVDAKFAANSSIINKYKELDTFNVIANDISTDQNKSLFSIVNLSNKILRIEEIYLVNVRTTNVSGIIGTFEIRRITNHSGGNSITNIEPYDTNDVLDTNITIRSNAAITGESPNILWRNIFSTDENNLIESISNTQHLFQTMFPIFVKKTNNTKSLTLQINEGIHIKFLQNSLTGLFNISCIFTQE